MYKRFLLTLICGLALSGSLVSAADAPTNYADTTHWLCLPGRADSCSSPVTSTVISEQPDQRSRQVYAPDPSAPIDCFYVYPTVSLEHSANADLVLGAEEQHVATVQFARFSAKCRTYAPLYRQATVSALRGDVQGADQEMAYRDVVDAWRFYLTHYNQGRGVVLVGHSQGARLLVRLIAEQIDGRTDQRRLVSAILAGTDIQVPVGRDAGGTFKEIPLCHRAEQTACVIAYSSYLSSRPPGPDSRFGGAASAQTNDACVDPAALLAHQALDSELPTVGEVARVLGTDLVENPGVISGACLSIESRTFLGITIATETSGGQRLDHLLTALDERVPGWGLHALDINLALGDLVEIVGRQSAAWLPHSGRS